MQSININIESIIEPEKTDPVTIILRYLFIYDSYASFRFEKKQKAPLIFKRAGIIQTCDERIMIYEYELIDRADMDSVVDEQEQLVIALVVIHSHRAAASCPA